ncbi:DUF2750 domain-containing protein [Pseudocolwellia sp. AS88]|uniref:DUF2750 domain-containing protein n=1 Tax=Gammaproteobacteria TaxID=1236 RepID=UPI0016238810|nr:MULTISPECIES: DUF2750 domain-containing protein [Gammaproteobacteria]MDO7084405.1 DUF2750 domain-containing protein [Pseudocolwellia sp. AS88]
MSSAGAQANKFYEEVSSNKSLWFAENSEGTALEFDVSEDKVSFPLWSSKSRILRLKKLNPELLSEFTPREISWDSFKEVLVPILKNKDRVVGVNLSGKNMSGFDMPTETVIKQVEAFL